MTQNYPQMNDTNQLEYEDEDEISLFELLTVIGQNKKKLIIIPFLCACLALGVSFVLTPSYNAKAVFVNSSKPASGSQSQLLESLGGGLGGLAAGALGPNSGDTLAALLESNAVKDQLIEKFHLQEYYEKKNLEETRLKMQKLVVISADKKSSLITVEVTDKDPQFAAKLANAHLEAIRILQKRLSKEEAHQRRDYFEQQIEVIAQRPFRDPFIQTALMNGLVRQYESARMDESRENLVIQEVDPAITPVKRTSPKRAMLVLIAGIGSFFLLIPFIFIRQAISNAKKNPEDAALFEQMKSAWSFSKKA